MNRHRSVVRSVPVVMMVGLGLAASPACGSSGSESQFDPSNGANGGFGGAGDADGGDDGSFSFLDDGAITATGECPPGTSTTISGSIYDPAGKNALYGVVAYVPRFAPSPFKTGVSCDSCTSLYTGAPIATALTDASGKFTLQNAPSGTNVPLVLQVGKWRKQVVLPTVTKCTDNPQPDKSLRLPKNHNEGDIPNIAISTGGADTLECLLRRMGVDAAEYVGGAGGPGRLHVFHGSSGSNTPAPDTAPAAPSSQASLWNSAASIDAYDMVLLSCEGDETKGMNQQVLFDYASAGGRIFASHFHYSWFNTGPFGSKNLAKWTTGAGHLNSLSADIVTALPSGTPFPKGVAMKNWLTNVNALKGGQLPIAFACHNADWTAANTSSQSWITAPTAGGATEYLSFNTPIGATAEAYCGRIVYSDLHVGAAANDDTKKPVPTDCADRDLSPEEKALEFMLFDLAACVTPDDATPAAPPIIH